MGGSEVLVIERHFNDVRVYEDISPTINTSRGGQRVPMIVIRTQEENDDQEDDE